VKTVLSEGFELPRGHAGNPDRTDKNPFFFASVLDGSGLGERLYSYLTDSSIVADKNTNDFWVKGCLCKSVASKVSVYAKTS
jgi:hypothetical protein